MLLPAEVLRREPSQGDDFRAGHGEHEKRDPPRSRHEREPRLGPPTSPTVPEVAIPDEGRDSRSADNQRQGPEQRSPGPEHPLFEEHLDGIHTNRLMVARLGQGSGMTPELGVARGDDCVENAAYLGGESSRCARTQEDIRGEVSTVRRERDAATSARPTFDFAIPNRKILGREAPWSCRKDRTGGWVQPLDHHQAHRVMLEPERLGLATSRESTHRT